MNAMVHIPLLLMASLGFVVGSEEPAESVARRQYEAARTIMMYGGEVDFQDGSMCTVYTSLSDHRRKQVIRVTIAEEEHRLGAPEGLCLKDCVTQLRHLPQLRSLFIMNDDLNDGVLQLLGPLDQLREFTIYTADVTDAGLKHLKGLSQLQTLILGDTKVTAEGVKKLQQALPNCTIKIERR
jgi:hypothetical protein